MSFSYQNGEIDEQPTCVQFIDWMPIAEQSKAASLCQKLVKFITFNIISRILKCKF